MRIIAGKLGGRQFSSPRGSRTHPMSEKMRGAIFSALGDIEDLTVLDAFAGSGALSFEALSRGASEVTFIEYDKSAQLTIAHNALELGLKNQSNLFKGSVSAWLNANPETLFDIVFCDPPYDDVQSEGLVGLAEHLQSGGIAVFSLPPNAQFILNSNVYHLLSKKSYGDSELVFYRKQS